MELVIEVLFALVFLRALAGYVAHRDPVQRDLMLVFSAMAVLTALWVVRLFVPHPPRLLTIGPSVLLLAQPYLTLRLVAQLRRVPRWLLGTALAAWLVTCVPLVVFRVAPTWAVAPIILPYVLVELTAAGYFVAEATRRPGAPRVRFLCAAAGTILFATAISVSGSANGHPAAARTLRAWALGIALVSALGYLLAFLPPRWLRGVWAAQTALGVGRELLDAPATELPEETWARYARVVARISGVDGVLVVFRRGDGVDAVARHGLPPPARVRCSGAGLDELVRRHQPVRLAEVAEAFAGTPPGTRFLTAVPLPGSGPGSGAVILFHRYRMLFDEDDVRLLGALGSQAAILAERGAARQTQVRLAADLSASVRALSAASQAKSDFLSAMSHELRTPLNAIIGFSELMRGEQPDGDRRRVPAEWIEHVYASGRHLLGLINDVLDLAKVEAGKVDLEIQTLDLPPVVEETVAALRPLADRKELTLTVGAVAPLVRADAVRLRQVLNNLLSNAIKFTPDGGSVTVEAYDIGDEVAISVTDTGVGIAPADQQRVFEEFQQAGDAAARQAGTGLGLALTRRLVMAQGGRIELASAIGKGSTFTVYLPASEVPAPILPADLPVHAYRGLSTVLVIEDDPGARHLLRAYLSDAGYEVISAPSGEEGLALARQVRPAAVLLDLMLPGIDGWEVLRQIKSDPQLGGVPVFLATVLDERDTAMAQGADDYFVKPIDRNRLLARLAERVLPDADPVTRSRALAIDYDRDVLALIEEALRDRGFEVVGTTSSHEALTLARTGPVDLIVSHLDGSDLGGLSLLRELSEDPDTRTIPVLLLAGGGLS